MEGENLETKYSKDNEGNNDTKVEKGANVPLWVWVIIIILILVCAYFLSLINSKKFQISEKNGYLIVKKGMFLPYGFSEYIPQDITKREAYSPIRIPVGEKINVIEVDKGELDIVLFKIIAGWVEKYLKEENENNIKIASEYITRLMKLSVSPDDFEKYSRLKGELIFKQAKFNFNMGLDLIKKSRENLINIKNLSPEFAKESEDILNRIEKIEKTNDPDYILLKRQDIDKIREDIKKDYIRECLRETMQHSIEKPIDQPFQEPTTIQEINEKRDEK